MLSFFKMDLSHHREAVLAITSGKKIGEIKHWNCTSTQSHPARTVSANKDSTSLWNSTGGISHHSYKSWGTFPCPLDRYVDILRETVPTRTDMLHNHFIIWFVTILHSKETSRPKLCQQNAPHCLTACNHTGCESVVVVTCTADSNYGDSLTLLFNWTTGIFPIYKQGIIELFVEVCQTCRLCGKMLKRHLIFPL